MQYAQVVVNSKTKKLDQKFTYLIQPDQLPYIKPGVLVEVPFGRKKIEGVIWDIKKHENPQVKSNLKPINKILDPNVVIDKIRRELAEKISNYYLSSIGEVVFFMIPPTAKRSKPCTTPFFSRDSILCEKKCRMQGKVYTLYDRYKNRIKDYIKLINKAIKNKRQILVLLPELLDNDPLINKIKSEFTKILVYDTSKTKTQRYKDWLDIRSGKYQIVIGTRSTIFSPLSNLGLIIIDQPHHFAYKEEQSPHYNSVKIAQWMTKNYGINLVLGDLSPSVEDKFYENNNHYHNLKRNKLDYKNIDLIDFSKEKSIISWHLEQAIKENLQKDKKIIIFVTRKGKGSALICRDCKHEFRCPNCDLPLIEHQEFLFCHHCNKKFQLPAVCPNCRGTNLISFGVGIDKVEDEIKKLFPSSKILKIEKDSSQLSAVSYQQYDIILGTKKIFSYPEINANLVGIINIDNVLNLPDYNSEENAYFTLVNLIEKTNDKIIIQTYNPEKKFYQYFVNNKLDEFLQDELKLRKKHNYPPFSRLIKVTCQNIDKNRAEKEINKIYKKLSVISNQLLVYVLGPMSTWMEKIRGKYRYQIIIKSSVTSYQLSANLKQVIENLPQGTSVDVDPLSLL